MSDDDDAVVYSDSDTEKAHQYRVIAYGCIKILGMFIYAMLMVWTAQTKVTLGFVLVICLLIGLVCAPIHGVMLLVGGIRRKSRCMRLAINTCLFIGAYDVFVGLFGFCVFLTNLALSMHLLLMILYLLLALNILRVLFYDYFLFLAYMKILEGEATTISEERRLMCDRIRRVSHSADEE